MKEKLATFVVKLAAILPASLKYQLDWVKPAYIKLLKRWGPEAVEIKTAHGNIRWVIDELTSQTFLLGTYEPYMQAAFQQLVKPNDSVYDIGAHAGFHALYCGLLVGTQGQIFAFEPNPQN